MPVLREKGDSPHFHEQRAMRRNEKWGLSPFRYESSDSEVCADTETIYRGLPIVEQA